MHIWWQKIISENICQHLLMVTFWVQRFHSQLLWQISADSLIYVIDTYRSATGVFLFVVLLTYFQEAVPRGSVGLSLLASGVVKETNCTFDFKQLE